MNDNILELMARPSPAPTAVADLDTLTISEGPSLGTGPLLTAIVVDGPTWSVIPAKGSTWRVIDRSNREDVGHVTVRKVRGKQRWKVSASAQEGQYRGFRHIQYMYPPTEFASRRDAVRAGIACLVIGRERLGVYPVVVGGEA